MYVDLGTGVRRSKDVPRITYVLKSALVPDLMILCQCHCLQCTSIKYIFIELNKRYLPYLYRVRSFALQPLSAGNSEEYSEADYSLCNEPCNCHWIS